MKLDERILTMVFAFDAGDSRREDVRALAADARAIIDELAETRAALANARAAAFEEAAQVANNFRRANRTGNAIAAAIRAHAALTKATR